jgi:hypothetical protein
MDSNQSGFTHFPRIPTNRVDNNQPSINDLTYTYRSLTQTMRDVMIGYNTNINTYNQNITSFLSTINDYRHDIRTIHTHLLNESRNSPRTTPPTTPVRPTRSRNTNMRRNTPTETQPTYGTTQSMTFSSPESLFSNIFTFPINTGARRYEDVIVSPTQQEIDNAVEVFVYTEDRIQPNSRCPITMEEFTVGDRISRIRYCEHMFREDAINNWFRLNVRCPVCRYDIREYTNNITDTSSNNVTDVSNTSIEETEADITNQITSELTNLLSQAWNEQLHARRSDISQNPMFRVDIPITVTSAYENEYDEDDDL